MVEGEPHAARRHPVVARRTRPLPEAAAGLVGVPVVSVHASSVGTGLAGLFLRHTVEGLQGPVLAVLRRTLLGPLTLPPQVVHDWNLTRDVALALLTVALLYAVLRAQFGAATGAAAPDPWAAVPRVVLAGLGVAGSLPLVRGLLAASNALTAAVAAALPTQGGLMRPLTAGLVLGLVPAALDIGADVVALFLLVGIAALACFYLVRTAEVVLLTLLLPIAAALWVVPAAAGFWRVILGELLVAIFVQPAQALVLVVFAAGVAPSAPQPGAWMWGLAALVLLFRVRWLLAGAVQHASRWGAAPGPAAIRGVAEGSAALADRLASAVSHLPRLPGV
jgi:hypothetical protein